MPRDAIDDSLSALHPAAEDVVRLLGCPGHVVRLERRGDGGLQASRRNLALLRDVNLLEELVDVAGC
jgi:hypothetical protein